MKRIDNLYDKICDLSNIIDAAANAAENKSK